MVEGDRFHQWQTFSLAYSIHVDVEEPQKGVSTPVIHLVCSRAYHVPPLLSLSEVTVVSIKFVLRADHFRTMVLVVDHMHQLGVMHRSVFCLA